jgi:hypothetical protein
VFSRNPRVAEVGCIPYRQGRTLESISRGF